MADPLSQLVWQIFDAIGKGDDGRHLWTLLEEAGERTQGRVYMTYGGETPESLAKKLDRSRLLHLLQLHEKLTLLRNQFDGGS